MNTEDEIDKLLKGKELWDLQQEMGDLLKEVMDEVLREGARKHGLDKFKFTHMAERYAEKAIRHLKSKQELDTETRLPHLYHALANIGILLWHYKQKREKKEALRISEIEEGGNN